MLRAPLAKLVDWAIGLKALNVVHENIPLGLDAHSFARSALDGLGVSVSAESGTLQHIPVSGPCIVVANHPHGGLDGLAMVNVLLRRRPDVRIMANHLLRNFIELRETFIGVDPFGGAHAARYNVRAVREALSWLRAGGLLMLFPGGEVSSFNPARGAINDPPWDSGIGWVVEKSNAPVVPVFIEGRNSLLFQLAGLLHPRLRTVLLLREMLNHRGTMLKVRCGRLVDAEMLALLGTREKLAPFLETATYLLKTRDQFRRPWRLGRSGSRRSAKQAIAEAVDSERLRSEIAALPPTQRLVCGGGLEAWFARADQIPWSMQEIGRLRELSFRQVGEGTGKSVDIDLHDSYYVQLFVWNPAQAAIVGGYRLGEADRIIDRYGSRAMYVNTLFRFERALENELGMVLDVGRSFVRPEYQRDYSSLMLLWKGIGAFIARHPHYRILLGPVSISNDYHPVSQQLIVRFLQQNSMEPDRASMVKARHPFRSRVQTSRLVDLDVSDLRIISTLLNLVEDDDIGIPVLLRQYLKLNGRILGFNVDPDFNNSIDCLLWLDLTKTDSALLQKYMGAAEAAAFLAYHREAAEGGGKQQRAG